MALFKTLLDEIRLTDRPANTFNVDESGIHLNSKARKVVAASTSKHEYSE